MKHLKYLILELGWFLPIIIAQWLFPPNVLKAKWKAVALVALPIAAYLSAKDKSALDHGTWEISADTSTGLKVGGVPIEEIIFFLLTSVVSAQGIVLLTDERTHSEWRTVFRLLRIPNQTHCSQTHTHRR